MHYHTKASLTGNGFEMNITNIDIKQNKENNTNYNFTANVQYQKEGDSQKGSPISGNVYFSKEGKISKFELLSDGGLSDSIVED